MPTTKDVKTVLLVAVGVIVAGYAMSKLRGDIALLDDAHDGFDS